ncbi:S-adenosylmethionine decarboxylase proenzyme [Hordeum vulgare]|nr:S-adenosylmethionine decarboxylase proenzyme [Hordeum vulgare]
MFYQYSVPAVTINHGLVNVLMESKGGKKSSSSSSLMYEAPLGYSIEDVRPAGGAKKFSAAYSNCAKKPS